MAPFVGESLTREELKALCDQAYGRFAHDAVTPLVQLDNSQWLLELFHGPTLAFKDVALQILGLLFDSFLTGKDLHLPIIGVTRRHTGSAAIAPLPGHEHYAAVIPTPSGRAPTDTRP